MEGATVEDVIKLGAWDIFTVLEPVNIAGATDRALEREGGAPPSWHVEKKENFGVLDVGLILLTQAAKETLLTFTVGIDPTDPVGLEKAVDLFYDARALWRSWTTDDQAKDPCQK